LLPPPCVNIGCTTGGLPSVFSYENLGTVKNKGIELGIDGAVNRALNVFANYSYQAEPEPDFAMSEINLPPQNRFNAGLNFSEGRYLANFSISYVDDAYWQDVLDARYAGFTDAFTQVNTTFGVKLGKVTKDKAQYIAQLKIVNLFNDEIQQHIFGDIFKRQIAGELRVSF
jgi:outer membrane receptor protein involved in Fe transport